MPESNSNKQISAAKGKPMLKQYFMRGVIVGFATMTALVSAPSHGANLQLSDVPLFLEPKVSPLNMLVVGRDHKLYYEAYNDASDLNGDKELDIGYRGYLPNPTDAAPNNKGIDYYGYFDSYKCYTYASDLFTPARFTSDKTCGGDGEWSGDFLNYLTMSRIDALRKVLYGGKRDVDTSSQTILIRSHIPMDAHSWGKEYSANDPYDIRQYTPYARPTSGRHLFANTTPNPGDETWEDNRNRLPRLRIMLDQPYRIWEWVSRESPVAGTRVSPAGSSDVSVTFSELTVRVEVCKSDKIAAAGTKTTETCKKYPNNNYKPTGLLHEFGENDSMLFGLLTGSYTANKSGGVLRKNIGSINDEITAEDGTLISGVTGIIKTLDRLQVAGYTRYVDSVNNNGTPRNTSDDWDNRGGTSYDCGLPAMGKGPPADGKCMMWGNPVAEMMYETLRYFRGKQPTSAFTVENNNLAVETTLGLPRPAWQDPYAREKFPTCAKPFQTVMADINNSYDTDQLPGTNFGSFSGDADDDLNVGTLATLITQKENISGSYFIGQSGAEYDGSPKPKAVTDLGLIRGLAPEEPTKEGGYYAASVAYHGLMTDANPRSDEKVQTFGVALASPLPEIKIPVGTTTDPRFVTLVPYAKSVKYNADGIDARQGQFQPTNQIVDFYIESIAADQRSGTLRVNFEDVEAGNDHDMDAIVRYSYRVLANGNVQVDVSSDYQAGGIIHHIGYVISGVQNPGVYLVVQDCNHTGTGTTDADYTCNPGQDIDYFLDTPGTEPPAPNNDWEDGEALKGFSRREFSPSGTGASQLQPPLWYAAKWGGFKDAKDGPNRNNMPDGAEWDENGDGNPDNYFLVTNALTLSEQLREAFREIIDRSSTSASASVNSGAISTTTRIYQAKFDTETWTGQLFAYGLGPDGKLDTSTPVWEAHKVIPAPNSRKIYTLNTDNSKVEFKPDVLDAGRLAQIHPTVATAQNIVRFVRGEEGIAGFRPRPNGVLGDIVSSAPIYVGPPRGRYADDLEAKSYAEFVATKRKRDGVVYVGANDGMLHAFKADHLVDPDGDDGPDRGSRVDDEGEELFAYVPKTVIGNLGALTRLSYSHRFFVDGSPNSADVFTNNDWRTVLIGGLNYGGQGIYAIDVTNPDSLGASSVMWEINDRTSPDFIDLGYTYSQPAIVRLQDGTWGAVFGNGYNSTEADGAPSATGNGVLFIVDIETGQLLRKFDTGRGTAQDPTGAGRPNGLATPTLIDVDGDRVVEYAYVGDLFGNVWKIDLTSEDSDDWDFAFKDGSAPAPFFVASDGGKSTDDNPETLEVPAKVQPITSRIEVARGPSGAGAMLLFGTGKFLENSDKVILPRADQTFYALLDAFDGETIDSRAELVKQTIEQEYNLARGAKGRRTSAIGLDRTKKGWYLDLVSPAPTGYQGERVVTNPIVRDDRVIFNTLIPANDPCGYGGTSWTMVLDLLSGSRLPEAQYDTDGNGEIDENDDKEASGITDGEGDGGILGGPASVRCLDETCQSDNVMAPSTNGTMDEQALRSLSGSRGRQSWRQIR